MKSKAKASKIIEDINLVINHIVNGYSEGEHCDGQSNQ